MHACMHGCLYRFLTPDRKGHQLHHDHSLVSLNGHVSSDQELAELQYPCRDDSNLLQGHGQHAHMLANMTATGP